MKNAVVLWTGGKDSAMALYESMNKYKIVKFVTFVPAVKKDFIAHPLGLMEAQSAAIGIDHDFVKIGEPYADSYRKAIARLKDEGIEVLITGDISTINGAPNWIRQCAEGLVEVDTPLWEHDRKQLLEKFIQRDFEVICSLSYKAYFQSPVVGQRLNEELVRKFEAINIDLCGENGEYHTCVLNAPFFKKKIELDFDILEAEDYFHLKINHIN
ncbi:hypothetical protein [Persicobacter diffluens]|uniref:Diphthamide synthase domain-containing protein n=1 Tax=Persicobacter diffluens TaxID=981 RepID=A0AAN5AJH4_9BACT|nr:hypothetical protein PEDI_15810 [Persicobacter diffluens]